MGQEQLKTDGPSGPRQEKTKPEEKDRAKASFERRIENNPAMKWSDSKPSPASRPE